jgi:hypothetical protein
VSPTHTHTRISLRTLFREKDLQRQVQTVKHQLRDLHTSNESTQAKLLDASQRQGMSLLMNATPPADWTVLRARRGGEAGGAGYGGSGPHKGE